MSSWWPVTITPPSSKDVVGKNGSTERASGGQICVANPMQPTSRPTVTTSATLTGPSPSPRVTKRCSSQPEPRAITTSSTSTSDSHTGSPWRTLKSQNTNDITMPSAPWAMLKTRVVV